MSETSLSAAGDGHWTLAGALDFATVPGVWTELERLLKAEPAVSVSLSGVSRANSAGLVLLVEARDLARRSGCRLALADIPAELLDLARMSGCEALISTDVA